MIRLQLQKERLPPDCTTWTGARAPIKTEQRSFQEHLGRTMTGCRGSGIENLAFTSLGRFVGGASSLGLSVRVPSFPLKSGCCLKCCSRTCAPTTGCGGGGSGGSCGNGRGGGNRGDHNSSARPSSARPSSVAGSRILLDTSSSHAAWGSAP